MSTPEVKLMRRQIELSKDALGHLVAYDALPPEERRRRFMIALEAADGSWPTASMLRFGALTFVLGVVAGLWVGLWVGL